MKIKTIIAIGLVLILTFLFNGCDKSKSDWARAQQLNTIEGYNEFLSKHPKSKFVETAKQKIEELTWDRTVKDNTIEAYQKFLGDYPRSKFVETAKQKTEELMWDRTVKDNTIEAYQKFLCKYPQSKFVETATKRIEDIKIEELDWQKAKRQNTIKAFQAFINKHQESNRLPSFSGSIKEVLVSAMDPSDVSIGLAEYPNTEFQTNLWDAVEYGLVEQKPMEGGMPFFSTYNLKDTKGWKVMLICKKRGEKDYYIITLKKL